MTSTPSIRDFDAEWQDEPQDGFTACGETFLVKRSVRPEKLRAWAEFDPASAKSDPSASIRMVDQLMADLLEPESNEQWREVRARDGSGELGIKQMLAIVEYVTGLIAGRPTSPLSPSGGGESGPQTGTPSTVDSPSPEATSGTLISVDI